MEAPAQVVAEQVVVWTAQQLAFSSKCMCGPGCWPLCSMHQAEGSDQTLYQDLSVFECLGESTLVYNLLSL